MFVFSAAIKRNFASGTRNKSTNWIGRHKEPLTEQQRLRRVNKHAPFVLGRDNVVQNYAPTVMNITESNQKPYKVLRTTNGYLPVYHDYKSARSQIITIIRRIEGDIEALRSDLSKMFNPQDISVKPCGIIVKGKQQRAIRYWLSASGF